ncbi:major facilitator superfamily domain-containing protein [Exophiala viscosa]|uniref:Major facilitator superfamily domain-containing protein n=1 Tax=Exophiala viscosa TaxID=2486360 RepID=A0AAN6DYS0_9EURO|nr:major facilitator superfamily domain-containing protein [Exophiala viscosa]
MEVQAVKTNEDGKFIHDWDGEDDPENPFNWSDTYKWVFTITVCLISLLIALPAGSCGSGNDWYERKFHVQNRPFPNLYWATTSWNMGAALLPLLFVPLTENRGRMPGYFMAYALFIIWLLPSAFAQNFATLVVTRFFGGGASSIAINLVGGTISDIWDGEKARSLPMSLFGFTSVAGIALGPFVGSAIVQVHKHDPWRWIFYIQIIYNAGLLPVFWFILRETRGDVILARRAEKLRYETGRPIFAKSELARESTAEQVKISFKRPVKMLLTEPVVTSFTLWVSFAVPQTFSINYGFDVFQTGLIQLAISVGALIGTVFSPLQDWLYFRSARKNKEKPGQHIPESRLLLSVPGSLLFTGGLFWYGWTCRPDIHWIVPTCGVACVGVGIYSIYVSVVNYLTDSYVQFAASALSAASLRRNVFAAFLPLASYVLFENLGYGWAGSLLGFIGLALSFVPVLLLGTGPSIRRRSPFMQEASQDGEHNRQQE